MKNKNLIIGSLIIAVSIFAISCNTAPKGDQALVSAEQTIDSSQGKVVVIDLKNSKVGFTGNGVGKNHPGYFKLLSGDVIISNGVLTGGGFLVDVKSLVLDQKEEMFQTKLLGHLLSADFFDAEKFPTFQFEISKVEAFTPTKSDTSVVEGANYKISGNLILKGVTKNVTFPAKVQIDGSKLIAIANFNIDRTMWGILYGNDKTLKDKFISETVNISLDIKSN